MLALVDGVLGGWDPRRPEKLGLLFNWIVPVKLMISPLLLLDDGDIRMHPNVVIRSRLR